MQIFDPRTGNQVNIIDLAAERRKRAEAWIEYPASESKTYEVKDCKWWSLRDYGDETDTTLKSYNDGTRDKV